jgi:hypothetical protein
MARLAAENILSLDENLSRPEHLVYVNELNKVEANKPNWSKIG